MSTSVFNSAQENLLDPSTWFDGYIDALTSTSRRYPEIISKLGDARKQVKEKLNRDIQPPQGRHLNSEREQVLKKETKEEIFRREGLGASAGVQIDFADLDHVVYALAYVQKMIEKPAHISANVIAETLDSSFKAICNAGPGQTQDPHDKCRTALETAWQEIDQVKQGEAWIFEPGILNLLNEIGFKDSDSSLKSDIKKALQVSAAAQEALSRLILICHEMRDIDDWQPVQ